MEVLQSIVESVNQLLVYTSVCKILHQHKFKPYKIHLVHELDEDDFDRRVEFCDEMMRNIDNGTITLNDIVFRDEATFMLNGEVNRHNSRWWHDTNPFWVQEQHTTSSKNERMARNDGRTSLGCSFLLETLMLRYT